MKIALGTAQFGLNYGITNSDGQVKVEQIEKILDVALGNKIDVIDTAISYGTSEKTLGLFDLSQFNVISKIPSLGNGKNVALRQQVEGSLERLGISKLYGLMLHSEQDAVSNNSYEIFEQLLELKRQGLVGKVGVSFYSPETAMSVLKKHAIDIIQVPANQLDNRFADVGVLSLAKQLGIESHIRSIFLQGLLAVSASERPYTFKGNVDLNRFDERANKLNLSGKELAMNYLLQTNDISKGVIGCTTYCQLIELISIFNRLKNLEVSNLDLASQDIKLIDPSLW